MWQTSLRVTKLSAIIASITILWIFFLDYAVGSKISTYLGQESYERTYRIRSFVYHHTLADNVEKTEAKWGSELRYSICTNPFGFKTSCTDHSSKDKKFDIAFIGDSFTESIGMSYEDSFVGRVAKALPNIKIANLAASSYAPSIYLAKVRYLLSRGFQFKHLIVFVDISDVQDEGVFYEYCNGIVIDRGVEHCESQSPDEYASAEIKQYIFNAFPLIVNFLRGIPNIEKILVPHNPTHIDQAAYGKERGSWTYKPESPFYGNGGVNQAIANTTKNMEILHALLKERGILFSVGIYPWPNQIKFDTKDSLQVKIWEEFCKGKCVHFFNTYPYFFKEKDEIGIENVVKKYYLSGDVHFNKDGYAALSEQILAQLNPKLGNKSN